jgi:prepilin-type N-terminal cleavage/methylation domain-containing protein
MRERGFSLIEVLIVVAIILIITAIAVPSYLHSKMAANESSAVYSIRTINTAQVTYATTYPSLGYASTLNVLAAPTSGAASSANAGILDWVLGCLNQPCTKSGYQFAIVPAALSSDGSLDNYSVWGVPASVGITGQRGFCSDNMNPVTYDPAGGINCTQTLE